MAWIKRNLYFVIGSVLALALMGGAGFYTYSRLQRNAKAKEDLNAAYAELQALNNANPHPGDGRKVDNIKAAREQQEELRRYLAKATNQFVRITPIPATVASATESTTPNSQGDVPGPAASAPRTPKVTGAEFASALRLTIAQLQREATNNSVVLPANYNFSFEAQRQQPFLVGNLEALAVQLGEVKTISDILNKAKINSLLSIRRERVSTEDNSGPPTDYLDLHSQTNELAILSPYEISFQTFSAELAAVISGFASSQHGVLLKSVNVRPAAASMLDPTTMQIAPLPTSIYPTPMPGRMIPPGERMSEREAFNRRYGIGGGGKDVMQQRYGSTPVPPPVAPVPFVTAAAPRGGLQPMLDERQLDVTLMVYVVKLLPPK